MGEDVKQFMIDSDEDEDQSSSEDDGEDRSNSSDSDSEDEWHHFVWFSPKYTILSRKTILDL